MKNPIGKLIKYIFTSLTLIIIPVLIIVAIFWAHHNFHQTFKITQYVLGFSIVITTLAIIVKIFDIDVGQKDIGNKPCNDESSSRLWTTLCLIKNFIFFLPCLLAIVADEIHKDVKMTPKSVYILFILELALVCLVYLLPLIFKFVYSFNKHDLLGGEGPFYLDKKKELGSYQTLGAKHMKAAKKLNIGTGVVSGSGSGSSSKISKIGIFDENSNAAYNIEGTYVKDKSVFKRPFRYTYSISFYLYLNPQPPNTSIAYNKDTELFNYGGKPVIYYNGKSRKLIIKSRTNMNEGPQMDTIYSTDDFKYQKWQFFVINYEDGVIDVFIDGKLVGSKKNIAQYFDKDKVTIGEHNGVHGSIKDIYYYENTRPVNNVEFLHDLTKN